MRPSGNIAITGMRDMAPVRRGQSSSPAVKAVAPSSVECGICHAGCTFLPPGQQAACHAICDVTLCP